MMQINYRLLCLFMGILCLSSNGFAQTVNFEETWKEFLENNKISNMSQLDKPNKDYDPLNYIKYLLMNTNTSFCQGDVERAEELLAAINDIEVKAHQAIPGFVKKLDDLESKVKAYHSMDAIWNNFLDTKEVDLKDLNAIKAAKTSCEKSTLAKYSYMTVYAHFCQGNIPRAKNILENRTLRLTEKTTLRVEDVRGLAPEVAKMKVLFQKIDKLDASWKNYVATGVSPGFDEELPLFSCYPVPNMKEWLLKGAANLCDSGQTMLDKIKDLQAESGVDMGRELTKKVKELEAALAQREAELDVLNEAWEAFLPNNEVQKPRKYGYEYCSSEPLIRAYIMDGFVNLCGNAEESLRQISDFSELEITALASDTKQKINELQDAYIEKQSEEEAINGVWSEFVAQGDTLLGDYYLADYYCDHVYDVKSWVIKGLASDCKQGLEYLKQIDEVKETLEFEFTKDVRCRVTKLRTKVWDCQYEVLKKLATIQVSADSIDIRIGELIEEYGIGQRPEVCVE